MAFVEHDSAAELGVDRVICRLPSAQVFVVVLHGLLPLCRVTVQTVGADANSGIEKLVPDAVVVAPVVTPEASTFVQLLTSPVGCRPDAGVGVGVGEGAGMPVFPAAHVVCPDLTVAPIGQTGVGLIAGELAVGVGL
jgi:hypothetical protein